MTELQLRQQRPPGDGMERKKGREEEQANSRKQQLDLRMADLTNLGKLGDLKAKAVTEVSKFSTEDLGNVLWGSIWN